MTVTSEGNSQVSVMHKRSKLCSAKDSTTKHTMFLIDLTLKSSHHKGLLERAMHFLKNQSVLHDPIPLRNHNRAIKTRGRVMAPLGWAV